MSFIVKGMNMPKDCIYCPCESDTACQALDCELNGVPIYGKRDDCPLIEIPTPHGRLIDADKIDYDEFWHREGQGFTIAVCQGAQRIIEEQPTIIEAEVE